MNTVFTCPCCGKKTIDFDRSAAYCNNRNCPVKSFAKSRLDGQKIIQRTKGDIFNSNWMHSDFLDRWLQQYCSDGTLLNVCCGYSEVGDVRIDVSPDSARTHPGDMYEILKQFGKNAFDYVYVDPRFAAYTSGENRNMWQFDALQVASKCLITRRPRVNVNLPSKKHYYAVVEETSPALSLLRFDLKNKDLVPNGI